MTAANKTATSLGENVSATVEGNKLTLVIDLAARNDVGNPKTIRVASTGGNKPVGDTDVVVGLNAYVYRVKKLSRAGI